MPAVTVVFGGRKIGTHQMRTSPFVVGRDASCGVHIDNAGVSRRHCQFVLENGCYYVEDAGSSNGTFLKGNRVTRAPVENGDEVNIGKFVLVFENNLMELLSSGEPSSAAGAPRALPPAGGLPPAGRFPAATPCSPSRWTPRP